MAEQHFPLAGGIGGRNDRVACVEHFGYHFQLEDVYKRQRASDDACTSFLFCLSGIRMAGKPPRVIPPGLSLIHI